MQPDHHILKEYVPILCGRNQIAIPNERVVTTNDPQLVCAVPIFLNANRTNGFHSDRNETIDFSKTVVDEF